MRYLPTAGRTIAAQGDAACALRLRAMKAMAMCHWVHGEDAPAEALVRELATARCEDGAGGLRDAVWLAARWWRPALVQRLVNRLGEGHPLRRDASRRLLKAKGLAASTRAALGQVNRRTGGLVVTGLERGAYGGRSGLRKGDVIVSVGAKPVRRAVDLKAHLSGASTSFLYYRDGQRIEASWAGTGVDGIDVEPLIERLP